ncbi:MAG: DUF2798 domain-containing protein [Hyphomicrobiaceae bacterium]
MPRHFAPYILGGLQSAMTIGIATAIATYQSSGVAVSFLSRWLSSWGVSWVIILTIVIGFASEIQHQVLMITRPPNVG